MSATRTPRKRVTSVGAPATLGNAIVRQVSEAHGGTASAENADGGGALLRVSFGPDGRDTGTGGRETEPEPARLA